MITHTLPQSYILDGQPASLSPLGLPALKLNLHAHLFYGHRETMNAFWGLGESLKLPIKDLMCDLLVQQEGLLTKHDLLGPITILDMGSETTSVMMFNQ